MVELFAWRDDLSRGALVTRLDATDADDGANAELEFALEYGDEGGLFAVDAQSGALTVAAEEGLDVARPVYRLVVSATDRGTPPLRTVADLEIRVNSSTSRAHAQPAGAHGKHCTHSRGVARNVNWGGAPLPCRLPLLSSPSPSLSLLTGGRGYNPGNFF